MFPSLAFFFGGFLGSSELTLTSLDYFLGPKLRPSESSESLFGAPKGIFLEASTFCKSKSLSVLSFSSVPEETELTESSLSSVLSTFVTTTVFSFYFLGNF